MTYSPVTVIPFNKARDNWNCVLCSHIETPSYFNPYYELVSDKDLRTSIPYYLFDSCGLSKNALHVQKTTVQTFCKRFREKVAHNFENSIVTLWFIVWICLLKKKLFLIINVFHTFEGRYLENFSFTR